MTPHQALEKYWGYKEFRPLQQEIISSVLNGKNTLAILPTGGGKSICYQIPALIQDGMTLVISPLIALMKDQVRSMNKRGVPAVQISSGMGMRTIDEELQKCMDGKYKLLYCSPERLQTQMMKARLPQMKINLVAVDEAHCISQWGHDFRPLYLRIPEIKKITGNVPYLALTASATPKVREDITGKLELGKEINIFVQSFARKNIRYVVLYEENKNGKMLEILRKVKGSGLIYTRTRKEAERLSKFLNANEIPSESYHAGMTIEKRNEAQSKWMNNLVRAMSATNAFGMGIDKSDVRFVIHYNLPSDLEAYYQEAGRAGRDGKTSFAVLLRTKSDVTKTRQWVMSHFPSIDEIKFAYSKLMNYLGITYGELPNKEFFFDIEKFSEYAKLKVRNVYECLRQIENEGYISITQSEESVSKIRCIQTPENLYAFQKESPNYEPLIQLLLRAKGAEMFQRFVPIDEMKLAKVLEWEQQKIFDALQTLCKYELFEYVPASELPRLEIILPRPKDEEFFIDLKAYKERMEWNLSKVDRMINYTERKDKCRSQIILEYFGEADAQSCGICDVCSGRHNEKITSDNFDVIQNEIFSTLEKENLVMDVLIEKIKSGNTPQREKVLRYLLDKGKVVVDNSLKLKLSSEN